MAGEGKKLPLGWILGGLGCLGAMAAAGLVAAVGLAAYLSSKTEPRGSSRTTNGGPVSCPVSQSERASNGDAIDPDLAHDLIVCLWQRPASIGSGAVAAEATDVRVGRRRKWTFDDMGSGNVDTWVYPVAATFTIRMAGYHEDVVTTDDGVFTCYVDAFARWECGLGQNLTRRSPQHIPK